MFRVDNLAGVLWPSRSYHNRSCTKGLDRESYSRSTPNRGPSRQFAINFALTRQHRRDT
jgi:hypothetical protein